MLQDGPASNAKKAICRTVSNEKKVYNLSAFVAVKIKWKFSLKRSKMMRGLLFNKGPVLETSTFVTYNTGLLWVSKSKISSKSAS